MQFLYVERDGRVTHRGSHLANLDEHEGDLRAAVEAALKIVSEEIGLAEHFEVIDYRSCNVIYRGRLGDQLHLEELVFSTTLRGDFEGSREGSFDV